MFSSFTLPFSRIRTSTRQNQGVFGLSEVPVHDVQKSTDKRATRLRALLKANHANHAVIYHNLTFHNHTPHLLGSAYILGGQAEHLTRCYEVEDLELEPWKPSPGEISEHDWRDFLGKREYQRAYVDFFEDRLVAFGYDWKALVERYMFEQNHPLINSVVSGLAHPLIHLAYAYELSSQDVAMEALALTACFHDELHKYLDDPAYSRPGSYRSTSPLDILIKVERDSRLDGLIKQQAIDPDTLEVNMDIIMRTHEDVVLDHWNSWELESDPRKQFEEAQRAATALLVGTRSNEHKFDFFLLHTLTSSHAVRVLLPLIPSQHQMPLVRAWLLFTIMAYIGQQRPHIDVDRIKATPINGKTWKDVLHLALHSCHSTDAHYVKGLRGLQSAADTWGDPEQYFLKAAISFGEGFHGFGGFGTVAI